MPASGLLLAPRYLSHLHKVRCNALNATVRATARSQYHPVDRRMLDKAVKHNRHSRHCTIRTLAERSFWQTWAAGRQRVMTMPRPRWTVAASGR